MNIKNISYYTQERQPLSLDLLKYNRFYNKTDIFIAANETENFEELFERLKKVLACEIVIKEKCERFIIFLVEGNNLKFKIKKQITVLNRR